MTQSRTRCALCREPKRLRESHYLPAGLYRLAQTPSSNPHPVLISGTQWHPLAFQSRAFVLCSDCESRFDRGGESWMLRHCCRGGRFRLRELLMQHPPQETDGDNSKHAANRTVEQRLTYFAASVFWRGAVYRWPIGRDFSQLLQFGPFEEPLRLYLLGRSTFPSSAALIVCVSNRANPPLASSYPMTYADAHGSRFHRFHIPGLTFTLYLGNVAEKLSSLSVTTAPEHSIWVGSMSDDSFMREVVAFVRRNNPRRG